MITRVRNFFILVLFSTYPLASFAAQFVGGLSIEYGPSFQENEQTARAWYAKWPQDFQAMIRKLEIFEAPGGREFAEVRLAKFHYTGKIRGDIDSAATGTIASISSLAGIRSPTHNIVATRVSGLDARRVTYDSARFDGMLGAEFLIIQDKSIDAMYQLQIIFSKKNSINSLPTPGLSKEHALASGVLSSVQVIKR